MVRLSCLFRIARLIAVLVLPGVVSVGCVEIPDWVAGDAMTASGDVDLAADGEVGPGTDE